MFCWPCEVADGVGRGAGVPLALVAGAGGRGVLPPGSRGQRTIQRVDLHRAVECRWNSQGDKSDARDKRDRQQNAGDGPRQVNVEVAEVGAAAQAADERHAAGKARRRRREHREHDGEHLAEVGQRAFTAVVLPVGVGDEAHGGVERQPRIDRSHAIRIERQKWLQLEDDKQHDEHHRVGDQHCLHVRGPALLLARVHAAQPVNSVIDRVQDRVEPGLPIGKDRGHIPPRGTHEEVQDHQDDSDLQNVESHVYSQNLSGLNSA